MTYLQLPSKLCDANSCMPITLNWTQAWVNKGSWGGDIFADTTYWAEPNPSDVSLYTHVYLISAYAHACFKRSGMEDSIVRSITITVRATIIHTTLSRLRVKPIQTLHGHCHSKCKSLTSKQSNRPTKRTGTCSTPSIRFYFSSAAHTSFTDCAFVT